MKGETLTMKKKILISVLAIIMVVSCVACFAACQKKDSKTDFETISEKGYFVCGITLYEPMNYANDDGEMTGFDTEFAQAVAAKMGLKAKFQVIAWDDKFIELNGKSIDCIWNGFTSSGVDKDAQGVEHNRRDLVDFSYNYMKNYQAVIVKASEKDNYTDLATSFAGKKGYAEAGSAGEEYAENAQGAVIQTAATQMSAITQVKSESADFAVVDYLLANSIIGKGDFADLAFVPALNSEIEYYGVGFKKGSDLTAKANAELEKFAGNGKLAEIAAKYGLDNAVIKDFSSQK